MNYYENIKTETLNIEITKKVKDSSKNKSDLTTYYNVGKLLSEAGKCYGKGIIKKYSIMITKEFGKGYNEINLKYFRQFYKFSNRHTVCDKLHGHTIEIYYLFQMLIKLIIILLYFKKVRQCRTFLAFTQFHRQCL